MSKTIVSTLFGVIAAKEAMSEIILPVNGKNIVCGNENLDIGLSSYGLVSVAHSPKAEPTDGMGWKIVIDVEDVKMLLKMKHDNSDNFISELRAKFGYQFEGDYSDETFEVVKGLLDEWEATKAEHLPVYPGEIKLTSTMELLRGRTSYDPSATEEDNPSTKTRLGNWMKKWTKKDKKENDAKHEEAKEETSDAEKK